MERNHTPGLQLHNRHTAARLFLRHGVPDAPQELLCQTEARKQRAHILTKPVAMGVVLVLRGLAEVSTATQSHMIRQQLDERARRS